MHRENAGDYQVPAKIRGGQESLVVSKKNRLRDLCEEIKHLLGCVDEKRQAIQHLEGESWKYQLTLGVRLIEAHSIVGRGDFSLWLHANRIPKSTAYEQMKHAKKYVQHFAAEGSNVRTGLAGADQKLLHEMQRDYGVGGGYLIQSPAPPPKKGDKFNSFWNWLGKLKFWTVRIIKDSASRKRLAEELRQWLKVVEDGAAIDV